MSFAAVAGKTGAIGAPSLSAMAQHSLSKRVHEIISFGDAPPHLIAPILRQVSDPNQLRALEVDSPQIAELTPDLWKAFIRRDIPQWETKIVQPQNPTSWWKVYRKLKRDDDSARQAAEEQLKATLNAAATQRKDNSALLLHAVLPEERQVVRYLDHGVKTKDVGRNALNALKRQNAHAQMTRATIAKNTPTNQRHPTFPPSGSTTPTLSRPLSKIQGLVRAAPRSMLIAHGARPTAPGPARFTPSSAPGTAAAAKRTRPRNPFRPGAANITGMHAEALKIAVRLEGEAAAARQARDAAKLAAIKAQREQGGSPAPAEASRNGASPAPRFPSITAKRAGSSRAVGTAGVPARAEAQIERKGSDEGSERHGAASSPAPSASVAAAPVPSRVAPAKRKGPSIFMAPKKAKKA